MWQKQNYSMEMKPNGYAFYEPMMNVIMTLYIIMFYSTFFRHNCRRYYSFRRYDSGLMEETINMPAIICDFMQSDGNFE